jgi:hypothetical protein
MRRFTSKGKKVYGTYKEGYNVYKDRVGYYIALLNRKSLRPYKKYLKGWKPNENTNKTRKRA